MSRFFLECSFDPPLTRAGERAIARRLAACLRIHGLVWRECLIDRERRRMLCSFESEHARMLMDVSRCARLEVEPPWTGTVYTPPWSRRDPDTGSDGLVDVAGERTFTKPATIDELAALERACVFCSRTHRVELSRVILSDDGRRAIVLLRAPDAESVRSAYRHVGLFDRVWTYRRVPALVEVVSEIEAR